MKQVALVAVSMLVPLFSLADDSYKVATVVPAATLEATAANAPPDRVSDQPVVHVESAEGRLGIGIVHRPVMDPGGPIEGIQHHQQSEVYRVMAGRGILVTAPSMDASEAIDPEGYIVNNLVGPSDRGVM